MIAQTFTWWLVISCAGLVALPIALVLFRSLPGRGIAFARPLGLLLAGYLFWLALTLELLPNRPGSVVWVLLLLVAVDAAILRRAWPSLKAALQERWSLFLAVEAVFFVALFTAAHIRSFIPEITGTEKPMDFMLLNAAARSTYYPPEDPWLAGFEVSYYYFGYVIQAMIGKLAAVPPAVAYNLALASTAALAATAAFGLGYELAASLRRVAFRFAVVAGLGAVLLVAVLGNLQGVLEFAGANGLLSDRVVRGVDIANQERAQESDACLLPVVCIKYPTEDSSFWWWWRATRLHPEANSITEFPFFSFILGDLHPHVMSIPYVFTAAALGLAFWRLRPPLAFDTWRRGPALLLLAALVLGGLGFLNTWDLPAIGFLVALLVLARNLAALGGEPRSAVFATAGFLAPLAALALLLYAPFYLGFSSQAGGLDAVRDAATRPVHAFLFWGPLLTVALALPLYRVAIDPASRAGPRLLWAAALPVALLAAWALLLLLNHGAGPLGDAITARGWSWLTAAVFAGGLVACLLALWRALGAPEDERALVPVLAAMTTALLLIFGAEFFFVRDVFASRLNTVFKLYYQAWLLLGVSGAVGAYWLLSRWRGAASPSSQLLRGAWAGLAAFLVAGALLYPLGATLSRTEGMARPGRTLDGIAFAWRGALAGDREVANWLMQRAGPGERLVEAVGPSYTTAARISAWTGVPTVLGWPGHQMQWGRDAALIQQRHEDVDRVYRSESLEEALEILQQYGVTYVFVGSVERSTYPAAGLQKFETGLQTVLRSGQSVLFRVPPADGEAGDDVGLAP